MKITKVNSFIFLTDKFTKCKFNKNRWVSLIRLYESWKEINCPPNYLL